MLKSGNTYTCNLLLSSTGYMKFSMKNCVKLFWNPAYVYLSLTIDISLSLVRSNMPFEMSFLTTISEALTLGAFVLYLVYTDPFPIGIFFPQTNLIVTTRDRQNIAHHRPRDMPYDVVKS